MTTFLLNTGASIPALGFGTWHDKEDQEDAVVEALRAGIRHIDTARAYGTEPMVGAAIRKSGVPRSEIFVTTKLWNTEHEPHDVEKALVNSLANLGLDYVDLFLIHFPCAFAPGEALIPRDGDGSIKVSKTSYIDTWKAMEKTLATGKTKAIGISNFSRAEVEDILRQGNIVPAVHQLECHPWLQQTNFTEWQKSLGIHITQYSPFGNQNPIYNSSSPAKLMDDPILVDIGKEYGKTGAQVALAWGISQGHSVLPKSKTPSRIKENWEGDFSLDQGDLEKIANADKKLRFNDPSKEYKYDFYSDLDGKQR